MFFPTPDEKFIRENFKDPELAEAIIAESKKRLKITQAIALLFLILFAGLLGYSLLQRTKAVELTRNGMEQQAILEKTAENAREEALKNQADNAKLQAEYDSISKQLTNCTTKKGKR